MVCSWNPNLSESGRTVIEGCDACAYGCTLSGISIDCSLRATKAFGSFLDLSFAHDRGQVKVRPALKRLGRDEKKNVMTLKLNYNTLTSQNNPFRPPNPARYPPHTGVRNASPAQAWPDGTAPHPFTTSPYLGVQGGGKKVVDCTPKCFPPQRSCFFVDRKPGYGALRMSPHRQVRHPPSRRNTKCPATAMRDYKKLEKKSWSSRSSSSNENRKSPPEKIHGQHHHRAPQG